MKTNLAYFDLLKCQVLTHSAKVLLGFKRTIGFLTYPLIASGFCCEKKNLINWLMQKNFTLTCQNRELLSLGLQTFSLISKISSLTRLFAASLFFNAKSGWGNLLFFSSLNTLFFYCVQRSKKINLPYFDLLNCQVSRVLKYLGLKRTIDYLTHPLIKSGFCCEKKWWIDWCKLNSLWLANRKIRNCWVSRIKSFLDIISSWNRTWQA